MDESSAKNELTKLIAQFHSQKSIRSWSMLISIFGDCIAPRGGELWMGNLVDLMQKIGVSSGVVRTAMSRLAADGWLERTRIGRNSFYRLTSMGREAFDLATPRIYARGAVEWSGDWVMALLSEGDDRASRRETLLSQGFGALAPNVLVKPDTGEGLPTSTPLVMYMRSRSAAGMDIQLAGQAWTLGALQAGYQSFVETYQPLHDLLRHGKISANLIAPETALLIRIMLIHDLRRLVLRDPNLPAQALPDQWSGSVAREMAAEIYNALKDLGEIWLDSNGKNAAGPLPSPSPVFFERFQPL